MVRMYRRGKDRAIMLWYEISNTAGMSFVRPGFDRQGEEKACALRRVVASPQAPTVRFHDGAADTKSHAGAVRLGGKKGIKDLVRLLLGESHAGITDRYHELLIVRPLRFDGEFAGPVRIFHRIDGIDHKIHEYLLQLHPISRDLGSIFRELRSD